jgi:Leu/Phe-tRNA-protein transferase
MMTEHFRQLGASEIPRAEFLARLGEVQERSLRLFDAL